MSPASGPQAIQSPKPSCPGRGEWLLHYEFWRATGEWCGSGGNHTGPIGRPTTPQRRHSRCRGGTRASRHKQRVLATPGVNLADKWRLLGSRKGTLRELASLEPQIRHLTDSLLRYAGALQLLPDNATKWLRFARLVEATRAARPAHPQRPADACRDRRPLDGPPIATEWVLANEDPFEGPFTAPVVFDDAEYLTVPARSPTRRPYASSCSRHSTSFRPRLQECEN